MEAFGILIITLSLMTHLIHAADKSVEGQVIQGLELEEHKDSVPIRTVGDNIELQHGLSIVNAISFDSKTNVMEFMLWETMTWKDYRLQWDSQSYGGLESIRVSADKVWTPDVEFYEGLDVPDRMSYPVVVYADGSVLWVPKTRQHVQCETDDRKVITCSLKVGSWARDDSQIVLKSYEDKTEVDSSFYMSKAVFKLLSTSAKIEVKKYDCCKELYPSVVYTMTFEPVN